MNQKFKTLQDVFGLPYTIEQILDPNQNSKIVKDCRKIKEAKERSLNL